MKIIDCPQYSDEWWSARLGKPSASNAKKLITSTGAPSKQMGDYAINLANSLFAGRDLEQLEPNEWMTRGTEMEAEARAWYAMERDIDVVEVGMFTDDSETYIASPDGVIDNGLLEIKCLKPTNHTKAILGKSAPTDYIAQIQMQLFVSEQDYCDLFFYCPGLPNRVFRVEADSKVIDGLKEQIAACLELRDAVLLKLKEL
jgi:putative phage-type endonuclease